MSSQFEGLLNDIELMRTREEYGNALMRSAESGAANIAEKTALRVALRAFDPSHPLMDVSLQEEIHDAAVADFRRRKDWDSVVKVGANYTYSYKQPTKTYAALEAENEALRAELERMKEAALSWKKRSESMEEINVQNYAEKHILRAAIEKMAPQHPLVFPSADGSLIVSALRKQALTAFAYAQQEDPSGAYKVVADVARDFNFNKPEFHVFPKMVFEYYPGETENLKKRLSFLTSPNTLALAQRSEALARERAAQRDA